MKVLGVSKQPGPVMFVVNICVPMKRKLVGMAEHVGMFGIRMKSYLNFHVNPINEKT